MENLNLVDAILGGIVAISALIGIARGLIREMLSLLAWVVAIWAAFSFSEDLSALVLAKGWLDDKSIAYVASTGTIFIAALFAMSAVEMLVSSGLKAAGLGLIDRFLGMGFGIARGLIIGALLVFFARLFPGVQSQADWQTSAFKPAFIALADWGMRKMPDSMRTQMHAWIDDNFGSTRLPLRTETRPLEENAAEMILLESLPAHETAPLQLESIRPEHN